MSTFEEILSAALALPPGMRAAIADSAEFSIIAPFLPLGLEPEVVAWDEENYLLLHRSKKYQNYLRPVLEKLEALPADQFRPNLTLIEKLVESLQIDNERPHQQ